VDLYYYIAIAAIFTQLVFLVQMYRNYHYVLSKYHKKRTGFRPKTAVIIPCKGLDEKFENNITSFFLLDYDDYLLWFVVAEDNDPAYAKLCQLKDRLADRSKARDIRVLLAGRAASCSQKIHNMLCAYRQLPDDVEVMAFADSDICVRSNWLGHLLYPLRKEANGAASGYRWFIPERNNLATLVLSAINAKIAQLLGTYSYVQAWGGSMAIRVEVFRRVGLHEMWQKAVSDDLSLSYAVKKAGLRIVFVPACLVGSYVETTWGELFEFGRRQFLITRIAAPGTWWFGLLSSIYSILGLWAGAAIAAYAITIAEPDWPLFTAVPILFFAGHLWRSILRQRMISKLLKDDLPRMKYAIAADILGSWLYSPLLLFFILSSAVGRTIRWRGIKYKLLGPTETVIESAGS
jgi:ceramide glucosyltransferase